MPARAGALSFRVRGDLAGGTVPSLASQELGLIPPWLPRQTQMPVGRGDIWPTELILGHCPSTAPGDRVRLSFTCVVWPLAGLCTAGTPAYLPAACNSAICLPCLWDGPCLQCPMTLLWLDCVPGEGSMCLRTPTEPPACLHGTSVCGQV